MNNQRTAINNKIDNVLRMAEQYAHAVYGIAHELPKHELYGLTSQLRRAALSVPLNVVEGYARQSKKSEAQFLTIAYGSLKEAQFILNFAAKQGYIAPQQIEEVVSIGHQTSKLIWAKTQTLRKQVNTDA